MPDESTRVATRPARRRRRTRAARPGRPALLVRVATPADVPVIARMRRSLARETTTRAPSLAELRERTRRQVTEPHAVVFLAERERRVVGVLRCAATRSPTATVTTVWVEPDARRRGVLRALLRSADAWCRERGLSRMQLGCGAGNAGGQAAWLALGFTPAAVLLRRDLPRG